jgi:hypothetical protein
VALAWIQVIWMACIMYMIFLWKEQKVKQFEERAKRKINNMHF